MAECECLATCPFFNDKMANRPVTSEIYKEDYCKGDNSDCARYMIFKIFGGLKVPSDLFPNQKDKAEKIIFPKNN
ncbi:MAG: hypothetical protein V1872_03665 [bacterium]